MEKNIFKKKKPIFMLEKINEGNNLKKNDSNTYQMNSIAAHWK